MDLRGIQRRAVALAIPDWEWRDDDVVFLNFQADWSTFYSPEEEWHDNQAFVVCVRRVGYLPQNGCTGTDRSQSRLAPFTGKRAVAFIEALVGEGDA